MPRHPSVDRSVRHDRRLESEYLRHRQLVRNLSRASLDALLLAVYDELKMRFEPEVD